MPEYEYDQFGQPIGILNSGGSFGSYTGLGTNSAPMQSLPTLPQTYSPTPGNPNYPVLSTPISTFGIPSKSMPTLGGMANSTSLYNPSNFDANLQNSSTNSAAMPTGAGATPAADAAGTAAGSALKAAGGMLGAGSFALGGLQTIGGLIGLATTKEPDKYSLTANTQQAIGESKSAAKFGLSPTQLAAYNTNVRQSANTDIYNARNMAGNSLSRAVFGVRRGQTLGALNNLAASDFEAMQRKVQYRNQMYGIEQGMKDRNTQLDWNQYGQKMQAYGGAMRSGLNNMAGFFNLGQALKYSSLIT
jgi:hypothetical protein